MRQNKTVKSLILLSSALAMIPSASFAGQRPAYLGAGAVISQNPGTYTFQQFDQAQLNAQILQRLDMSRQNDRLYVQNVVDSINELFNDIIHNELAALIKASAGSTSSPIAYTDYVAITNAYINKRQEIDNKIGSLTKLPSALTTSSNTAGTAQVTVTLPGQLVLDFTKLVGHYNDQFSNVDGRATALSFNVKLPNGSIQSVNNINGDGIDKANLISQAMLDQMSMDIRVAKAMVLDHDAINAINNLNKFTLTLVTTYINNQGKTEQWRFSDMHTAVNNDEIKSLMDTFWLRSYIRTKYGVQLGGIGIEYKKKILNLDKMFSPDNLVFHPNLRTQADINTYRNLMQTATATYEGQAHFTPNPMQWVALAINRVKGKWNEAEANLMVINMLVSDLTEENMIIQGGGLRKMHDEYTSRYFMTQAHEKYYRQLARDFNGDNGDDAYADVGIASSNSARGIYSQIQPVLNNVLARQEKVDRMTLAYSQLTSQFKQLNRAGKRGGDLE